MKRNCILLALLCCLFAAPSIASANPIPQALVLEETELPASTVEAVLREVDNRTEYTYSNLAAWYQIGRVTIEVIGVDDYKVTIYDEDGLGDVVLIENL